MKYLVSELFLTLHWTSQQQCPELGQSAIQQTMFVDYLSACSDDTDLYFSDRGDNISVFGSSIMRDMTDDQV